MGFMNTIFGKKDENSEEAKALPWKELTSMEQLATIEENQEGWISAIFKHSTRCGVSRMALRSFENGYRSDWEGIDYYYLDLLKYRAISNEVAQRFAVVHQSPQLILIKDGKVVHHASHHQIAVEDLEKFL